MDRVVVSLLAMTNSRVICPRGSVGDAVFGPFVQSLFEKISVFPKCKSGVHIFPSRLD